VFNIKQPCVLVDFGPVPYSNKRITYTPLPFSIFAWTFFSLKDNLKFEHDNMKSFNFSAHGIICGFNFKQVSLLISIFALPEQAKTTNENINTAIFFILNLFISKKK
jgi:hypothetical protein